MNRRTYLQASLMAPSIFLLAGEAASRADDKPKRPARGVTLAGAEFGEDPRSFSNETPGELGKAYVYNSEKTFAYFASRGITTFRIPFRWERLQPKLGQPFRESELALLVENVARARRHGGRVILDPHNYGRYALKIDGKIAHPVIDSAINNQVPVTREHFADFWKRLSAAFRDDPAVYAYGLVNEPHDMGKSDWKGISQAAVDAIRASGDRKLILVGGDSWSSARRFVDVNGTSAWIKDPMTNTAYEAHTYWDSDNSGTYKLSYDDEMKRDPGLEFKGVRDITAFAGWCTINGVRGFIGEFGVPNDDPRWLKVMAHFLEAVDRLGMETCYWAAGEWWGDYRLSLQPKGDFRADAVQLAGLVK